MVKSNWPLALTNIMLMAVFNVDPVISGDGACGCGVCDQCNATIALLDHKIELVGLHTRRFLTKLEADLREKAHDAEKCIPTRTAAYLRDHPNLFKYAPYWAILPTAYWANQSVLLTVFH